MQRFQTAVASLLIMIRISSIIAFLRKVFYLHFVITLYIVTTSLVSSIYNFKICNYIKNVLMKHRFVAVQLYTFTTVHRA